MLAQLTNNLQVFINARERAPYTDVSHAHMHAHSHTPSYSYTRLVGMRSLIIIFPHSVIARECMRLFQATHIPVVEVRGLGIQIDMLEQETDLHSAVTTTAGATSLDRCVCICVCMPVARTRMCAHICTSSRMFCVYI